MNELWIGILSFLRGFWEARTLDFDECIMIFKVFEKSDVSSLEATFGGQKPLKMEIKWTPNLKKSLSGRLSKII